MTLRKKASLPTRLNRLSEAPLDPTKKPERLVGLGFRRWIAGYDTHDINCWEKRQASPPPWARPDMCLPDSPPVLQEYLQVLK